MDFDDLLVNVRQRPAAVPPRSPGAPYAAAVPGMCSSTKYQDTNHAQVPDAAAGWAGEHRKPFTVVGDDAQSIYSFPPRRHPQTSWTSRTTSPNAKGRQARGRTTARRQKHPQRIQRADRPQTAGQLQQGRCGPTRATATPIVIRELDDGARRGAGSLLGRHPAPTSTAGGSLSEVACLYRTNARSRGCSRTRLGARPEVSYQVIGGNEVLRARRRSRDAMSLPDRAGQPGRRDLLSAAWSNSPKARGSAQTSLARAVGLGPRRRAPASQAWEARGRPDRGPRPGPPAAVRARCSGFMSTMEGLRRAGGPTTCRWATCSRRCFAETGYLDAPRGRSARIEAQGAGGEPAGGSSRVAAGEGSTPSAAGAGTDRLERVPASRIAASVADTDSRRGRRQQWSRLMTPCTTPRALEYPRRVHDRLARRACSRTSRSVDEGDARGGSGAPLLRGE